MKIRRRNKNAPAIKHGARCAGWQALHQQSGERDRDCRRAKSSTLAFPGNLPSDCRSPFAAATVHTASSKRNRCPKPIRTHRPSVELGQLVGAVGLRVHTKRGPKYSHQWAGKGGRTDLDQIELVSDIDEDAWQEWCMWRKREKKKPVGTIAAKKQRQQLAQLPYEVQRKVIDHSIANGYQGLFPEKFKQQATSTRRTSLRDDLTDTSWAD